MRLVLMDDWHTTGQRANEWSRWHSTPHGRGGELPPKKPRVEGFCRARAELCRVCRTARRCWPDARESNMGQHQSAFEGTDLAACIPLRSPATTLMHSSPGVRPEPFEGVSPRNALVMPVCIRPETAIWGPELGRSPHHWPGPALPPKRTVKAGRDNG
jgi:hypothetical protein